MNRRIKNRQIRKTRRKTIVRHKRMACKTYELKVDKSHLSGETLETLRRLFLEAKWFYNHLISQGEIWDADYKVTNVLVRTKDKLFESRALNCLSSQMRQEIIDRVKDNIRGLSVLKKNGHKVGALGFKSRVASIPLKQNGITYRLDGDRIGIQNIKQPLKVRGIKQIPEGAELTSATLEQRNGDYFVHVTTYQKMVEKKFSKKGIGVDAGIKNQLTLSNGLVIREGVSITRRIRLLHRQLDNRKKTHGKNWLKTQLKLNREYDRIANERADIRHKLVSRLVSTYDAVATQDDNIRGWQMMWGRRVTTSVIGGIMSDLRTKSHTPVEVDRFTPTTRPCSNCGAEREVALDERVYECHSCGLLIDRDFNSAKVMWKAIPAERRELTPVDTKAATGMMEYFNSIPGVSASLVVETGSHPISIGGSSLMSLDHVLTRHVEMEHGLLLVTEYCRGWYPDHEGFNTFSWSDMYPNALSPSLRVCSLEKATKDTTHDQRPML